MRIRVAHLIGTLAVLAIATGTASSASAQVSIPNIQNPINKAKAAAEKTNQQINSTNKAGAGIDAKGASNAPGQAAEAMAADQQKKAAAAKAGAAPQKAGTAPQPGASPKGAVVPAPAGAAPGANTTQVGGSRRPQATIYREIFAYNDGGRRDPFVSLMASGELRPIITDLVLTGVVYDSEGRRSVALVVDASTGEAYRVRVGQALGRMKVTKIGMQDITFSIDEFGLSRSETLIIDKTRKGPVAGRRP